MWFLYCTVHHISITNPTPHHLPPVTFVSFWWCRALERLAAGNEKTRARLSLHTHTHNARGGEKNVFGFYRTESRHSTHKKKREDADFVFCIFIQPTERVKLNLRNFTKRLKCKSEKLKYTRESNKKNEAVELTGTNHNGC